MEEISQNADSNKFKLVRCMDWLQKQNHPKKLAQQNKNDIQFIIETNAHRKKFLLSAAEDDATVPEGVDETKLQPKVMPLSKLRYDGLCMQCEWQSCQDYFVNYDEFQKHVAAHASDVQASPKDDQVSYACLWDICGHETKDFNEMVRHINYHAYHAYLLAIGFNGRATLKLESCRKDSTKRNQLPSFLLPHTCLWFECKSQFHSFQTYLDHVKLHIYYSEDNMCSWAGCGMKCSRRALLTMHVRSHTGEKLIACYHCGRHFCNNHKLVNHLARQNVAPECGYQCSVCRKWYATEYLVREHARQHVSYYACSLCDMSATTRSAIATHMSYRHLAPELRTFACPQCPQRFVRKYDLTAHLLIHERKNKKRKRSDSDEDTSDEGSQDAKKAKEKRKYECHMCPPGGANNFSRGHNLTTHLVKVHGAQWPCGHSRFRYQISEDGIYRLITTRIEDLEVSKKIVFGGFSGCEESLSKNKFDYDLKQTSEATIDTPMRFEISLKDTANAKKSDIEMPLPFRVETVVNRENRSETDIKSEIDADIKRKTVKADIEKENKMENDMKEEPGTEICMLYVDASGNIVSSEMMND